jgi:hypothetical protein
MAAYYLPLLFSALALIFCIFSFFYFKNFLRRRTAREWILQEVQEEVNKMLVSLDETTLRDISLIEEREKNLKKMLEDIDKRLKAYIREMDTRRDADNSYAALGKNRYRGNNPPGESAPGTGQAHSTFLLSGFKLKPGSHDNPQAAGYDNSLAGQFAQPSTGIVPPGPLPADTPALNARIRELVQAGFPAPVIASRLGISIAAAELAAALAPLGQGNDENKRN